MQTHAMMVRYFTLLIILCLDILTAVTCALNVASEVHCNFIVRPSESESCDDIHRCSIRAGCGITLSQFINNDWTSDNRCNDTKLIFSAGIYGLDSELVVENVHSFSMFAWPGSSSKVVITCNHNARFKFSNISSVTVSGLEFIGCFDNYMISVDNFHIESSGFFGNGRAIDNGTVIRIEKSTASLNRVVFLSMLNFTLDLDNNCTTSTMDRVTGILLKRSTIIITQSCFEGNNIGHAGAITYDEFGSDIIIFNTTFVNNSATMCSTDNCSFVGGIVHISKSHNMIMSIVKIYHSKFVQNNGGTAIILTFGVKMQVSNSKFINNTVLRVLYAKNTSLSINHSDLVGNKNLATIEIIRGTIITINHVKLINNAGSYGILVVSDTTLVTVTVDFLIMLQVL